MTRTNEYDRLECPSCRFLSRPRRVLKSGTVTYRCDNPSWCQLTSFGINRDGDLVNERYYGNDVR